MTVRAYNTQTRRKEELGPVDRERPKKPLGRLASAVGYHSQRGPAKQPG